MVVSMMVLVVVDDDDDRRKNTTNQGFPVMTPGMIGTYWFGGFFVLTIFDVDDMAFSFLLDLVVVFHNDYFNKLD